MLGRPNAASMILSRRRAWRVIIFSEAADFENTTYLPRKSAVALFGKCHRIGSFREI